jgi:prolyl-tRNA synthetase
MMHLLGLMIGSSMKVSQSLQREIRRHFIVHRSAVTNSPVQGSSLITPRAIDFSAWYDYFCFPLTLQFCRYSDVLSAADVVDQSPVRGCPVIKPWGMAIWDLMQRELGDRIKATGTSNVYFPLLIPLSFLSKEAEHVDGYLAAISFPSHLVP